LNNLVKTGINFSEANLRTFVGIPVRPAPLELCILFKTFSTIISVVGTNEKVAVLMSSSLLSFENVLDMYLLQSSSPASEREDMVVKNELKMSPTFSGSLITSLSCSMLI
jgi:hypothetical protein